MDPSKILIYYDSKLGFDDLFLEVLNNSTSM